MTFYVILHGDSTGDSWFSFQYSGNSRGPPLELRPRLLRTLRDSFSLQHPAARSARPRLLQATFGNRGVLVLFDVGYPGNCCIQHGKQCDTQVDGYPSRQGPVVAVQPPLRTSFRMPMACAWPRTMWKVQILKVQYLMVPILCHKETQWKPRGI